MRRKFHLRHAAILALTVGLFLASALQADEVIDVGTYVPAPGGSGGNPFDRLHANRATIGTPYSLTNPPEPAGLPDGTLLVSKRLGVGTTSPQAPIHILQPASETTSLLLENQNANDRNRLTFRKSRPGPAAIQTNDALGTIRFDGYNGASYPSGARIIAFADDNWSASTAPARLSFFVAPPNNAEGGATTEVMRIASSGRVGVGTTDPLHTLEAIGNIAARRAVGTSDLIKLGALDPNVGLTLRSGTTGGTPYIDFVNDTVSDFDMRLILMSNDYLSIQGGNVGIETATTPQARLEVNSTLRLTPASAPANPQEGTIYFNSRDKHFYGWNGSIWKRLDT